MGPETEDSAAASAHPVVLGRPPVDGANEDLDGWAKSMVDLMLGPPTGASLTPFTPSLTLYEAHYRLAFDHRAQVWAMSRVRWVDART